MAKKEKIEMMIEGGNAKPDASVSQKLGPMGVPIPKVMSAINEKTAAFKGMKVPVKIFIDPSTKNFDIEIGTPPVGELIKNEIKIKKAAGKPNKQKAGVLSIEQCIKIAIMKKDSMYVNSLKAAVKSVVGSANSAGLLVENKLPVDVIKEINEGKYDNLINKEISSTPEEKSKEYSKLTQQLQDDIQRAKKAEEAAKQAEAEAKKTSQEEAAKVAPAAKPSAKPAAKKK
jgi:large subunit ribosomal protein L11